jgi:hypothetical protein
VFWIAKRAVQRGIRSRPARRLLWFTRRTEAIVAEGPANASLRCLALVSVVKSSDLRNRYDAPAFWLLHYSRLRSVFGQRQMSSGVLVVDQVTLESLTQRSFIPHDDVVQTFAPDGTVLWRSLLCGVRARASNSELLRYLNERHITDRGSKTL